MAIALAVAALPSRAPAMRAIAARVCACSMRAERRVALEETPARRRLAFRRKSERLQTDRMPGADRRAAADRRPAPRPHRAPCGFPARRSRCACAPGAAPRARARMALARARQARDERRHGRQIDAIRRDDRAVGPAQRHAPIAGPALDGDDAGGFQSAEMIADRALGHAQAAGELEIAREDERHAAVAPVLGLGVVEQQRQRIERRRARTAAARRSGAAARAIAWDGVTPAGKPANASADRAAA